jgi:hypothetical protein
MAKSATKPAKPVATKPMATKPGARKRIVAKKATTTKLASKSTSKLAIKSKTKSDAAKRVAPKRKASSKPLVSAPAPMPVELKANEKATVVDGVLEVVQTSTPKQKLVRDSFTMPRADFELVDVLKARALVFHRPAKKSELLRAGLHALAALGDAQLRKSLETLTPLKAGRPKRED